MNYKIKNILLEVIKSSYLPSGRPSSKELSHYLNVIIYVLNSDIKWKYLNEYAKDPEDRVDDYWTDHAGSVTLDEYNAWVQKQFEDNKTYLSLLRQ